MALVNCWPQAAADGCEVAISYQLTREDLTLTDVVITLPLPRCAIVVPISLVLPDTVRLTR